MRRRVHRAERNGKATFIVPLRDGIHMTCSVRYIYSCVQKARDIPAQLDYFPLFIPLPPQSLTP